MLKFSAEPDRDLYWWAQWSNAEEDASMVAAVNAALNVQGEEEEEKEEGEYEREEGKPAAEHVPAAHLGMSIAWSVLCTTPRLYVACVLPDAFG